VYLLVDPANGEILYVGEGAGLRFAAHLRDGEQIVGDDAVSDGELGGRDEAKQEPSMTLRPEQTGRRAGRRVALPIQGSSGVVTVGPHG
jgi:hypothetical protein